MLFQEPPTKFALLPFHLAPAPRHRKGRDARIRPRDPRQRALPNAHARAHARTPREPSFSREKQSRPSLAFFRRTAVALPRLISLRRTHARNARARSRTGDMVNDGKNSSVWSVEEDAELARLQVRPLSKQRFDPHLVFFSVTALAAVVRWVPRAEARLATLASDATSRDADAPSFLPAASRKFTATDGRSSPRSFPGRPASSARSGGATRSTRR